MATEDKWIEQMSIQEDNANPNIGSPSAISRVDAAAQDIADSVCCISKEDIMAIIRKHFPE